MYQKIANFIRGSVLLQVESAYPERIVNLCSAHGIPFWDVRWRGAGCFTVRTSRSGAARLRRAAEHTDAVILRLREQGVPVLALGLRRRYVLLLGGALLSAVLAAGNFFIWDFEVTGNETVPDEVILRALERQGVTVGCPGLSFDQERLRNRVLLEVPDISWLAVNVKGCVAHVQVVERHRPPPIVAEEERTNVVADRDGLVTRVETLDGVAMVLPGATVVRGQLLISGVAEGGRSGVRLVHGMGNVWARTWYELSTLVPLKKDAAGPAGKPVKRVALDFGKTRLTLGRKGLATPAGWEKTTVCQTLRLPGGLALPVRLAVEEWTPRAVTELRRSAEEARKEGEATLLAQLETLLRPGGTVTETRFAAAEQGDWLLVTLKAECLEQIGVSVPLGGA